MTHRFNVLSRINFLPIQLLLGQFAMHLKPVPSMAKSQQYIELLKILPITNTLLTVFYRPPKYSLYRLIKHLKQ
jgi:hypothetical protein